MTLTDRKLIVVLGIDGSGKSTVSAEVIRILREHHGVRAALCWARWQPRVVGFVRRLVLLRFTRAVPFAPGKEEPKKVSQLKASVFGRWRLLGLMYLLMALGEYWLQYWGTIRRLNRTADLVLLDRYWYDVVIDAVGNDPTREYEAARLVRGWYRRMFPRPTQVILLDVDESIARQRKGGENPIDYLVTRRRIYRLVVESLGGTVIDASRPVDEVIANVLTQISRDAM